MVYDHWRNHWIGGLISPDEQMMISQMCPSGDASIYDEVSFLKGLVGALASGIYVPTTVKVRCAGGGPGTELDLDPETLGGSVDEGAFLDWVGAVAPDRLGEVASAQAQIDR